MDLTQNLVLGFGVGLLILAGASMWVLLALRRDRRLGRLASVDDGRGRAAALRSNRWGLAGRPDELRRQPDGALIPVEWKSRERPNGGPPRSHVVQVETYCLLVEETTGRSPAFGVLRYRGGAENRVPWNDSTRDDLLRVLDEVRRPYDGRATPSPRKCARCRWRDGCDIRAG